jgi:hypothetical protein
VVELLPSKKERGMGSIPSTVNNQSINQSINDIVKDTDE